MHRLLNLPTANLHVTSLSAPPSTESAAGALDPETIVFVKAIEGVEIRGSAADQKTYVVLLVDNKEEIRSKVVKRSSNPQWIVNDSIPLRLRHSSEIKINIYQPSRLSRLFSRAVKAKDRSIGGVIFGMGNVLKQTECIISPLKGPKTSGRIKVDLGHFLVDSLVDFGLSSASDSLDRAFEAIEYRRHPRDDMPAALSTNPDPTNVAVSMVQAGVNADQQLGSISSLQPLGVALRFLDALINTMSSLSESHPALQAAWTLLSFVYKTMRTQSEEDETVRDLAMELCDLLGYAQACSKLNIVEGTTDVILGVGNLVSDAALFIDRRMRLPFAVRATTSVIIDAPGIIRSCQVQMERLQRKLAMNIQIRSYQAIVQADLQAKLGLLPRADLVSFDVKKKCLDNTRVDIIQKILNWTMSPDTNQPMIFWLYGMAGEGKTSIATSVAARLHDEDLLGGSFFFDRDHKEAQLVFSTLAIQLADHRPEFAQSIANAISRNQAEISKNLHAQFDKLFKGAMNNVEVQTPVIFILDALDDCVNQKELVKQLSDIIVLPKTCRFLITSRPDDDIQFEVSKIEKNAILSVLLKEDSINTITDDISYYIDYHLKEIRSHMDFYSKSSQAWPDLRKQKMLVEKCSGLFIWASTAINFISHEEIDDPEQQLNSILEINHSDNGSRLIIDDLYIKILEKAYYSEMPIDKLEVIGCLITVHVSVSVDTLVGLLVSLKLQDSIEKIKQTVTSTIRRLKSVISVSSNVHSPLEFLHPTSVNFMTDKRRSDRFWVDEPLYHLKLAKASIQCLCQYLHENICHLGNIVQPNSEIKDLKARLAQYLPSYVQYASQFWTEHVAKSLDIDISLSIQIEEFLYKHLLNWIEALSLCSHLDKAHSSLKMLEQWNQQSYRSKTITSLVTDAEQLLVRFWEPIQSHSLHIYISALHYAPKASAIYSASCASTQKLPYIKVLPEQSENWSLCLGSLKGHENYIKAIAYSPDGSQIVSASNDTTLRIWNARTGAIEHILKGHTGYVVSVVYSPDNLYIASGSKDYTLYIWNPQTGIVVGEALKGHTGPLTRIAFSPDSSYIVSASDDKTLRIWHIKGVTPTSKILRGHKDCVKAVAYSPDGLQIVSASYDKTLRLWNAKTGHSIGQILEGHSSWVQAVAYSPDNCQIVSVSADKTVRFWNALTGAPIGQVLKGHTSRIIAVAFAPDSSQVVSASEDKTLRIWNAKTRAPIGQVC